MDWFPRRHVIVLARSSSGRLAYLEKIGMVIPHRVGLPPHGEVVYSWEQILEIRAISHLRQHLSFQAIRRILDYFEQQGFPPSLRDKQLIIANGVVNWVRPRSSTPPQILELISKTRHLMGQYRLVPLDLADGSLMLFPDRGNRSNVIDFEKFRQSFKGP
ncbi:MAG: hypothetical protein KGQ93_09330 [Cyanobacteria bacterium REEB459]|nr:hypothetical protein [Cyanobacteria bacterium REEB459]